MDPELEPQPVSKSSRKYWLIATIIVLLLIAGVWWNALRPAGAGSSKSVTFEVASGDGLHKIAENLSAAGLIKSPMAFEVFSFIDGIAGSLKPGIYQLNAGMSGSSIAHALADAGGRTITVTIPEGSNLYQIDKILSDALVIKKGDLITALTEGTSTRPLLTSPWKGEEIEGRLFPDTYEFTSAEPVAEIIKIFTDDFNAKAQPLFANTNTNETSTIMLASILEKEVQTSADQRTVAGILLKRIAAGIPLDVDASVCYGIQVENPTTTINCASLTSADFKIDTPYNTYLHRGFPPGPIGNPGISTIEAALNPVSSPYFYYLTDPATSKTVYATTLTQQNMNIRKYLE